MSADRKASLAEVWGTEDFESLFTFYYPGFNLRSTDLQAFIGLKVLDRLDGYANKRNSNFLCYNENIKDNVLNIKQREGCFVSNLAYPVVSVHRNEIVKKLISEGIETRPLVAGNMGRQPFWIKAYKQLSLKNADMVHKYGFYLPNHQDITEENIKTIANIVNNGLSK